MTRMINEFKEEMYKQLNEFKEDTKNWLYSENIQTAEWNEDDIGYEKGIQKRQKFWKKNQIEVLEMKSSWSKIKTSTESIANRTGQVENRMSGIEGNTRGTWSISQRNGKTLRKYEWNMTDQTCESWV
jgi:hypothetical protein